MQVFGLPGDRSRSRNHDMTSVKAKNRWTSALYSVPGLPSQGRRPLSPSCPCFAMAQMTRTSTIKVSKGDFHGVTSLRYPGQLALYTWVEFCHSAKVIHLHGCSPPLR